MATDLTILCAGGGTGGHLFPALAVSEVIRAQRPNARIRFLCSDRAIDARIMSAAKLHGEPVDFEPVPAKPFGVRPRAAWRFLKGWGASIRAGRSAIRAAKKDGPVVVASFGGFVAAPIVQAARAERIPVIAANLDATPGLANRWIGKHADRVLTTIPAEGRDWEVIGPIVRAEARAPGTPAACRERFGLDPSRPTLLVTGASQGAGTINDLMLAFLSRHGPLLAAGQWQVIHQVGPARTGPAKDNRDPAAELAAAYKAASVPAHVAPFIDAMGAAWGAADCAVSRAGAGSVAEAWANAVPTLFLPYPFHRDQHQKKNAAPLVDAGAALMCADLIDPARNIEDAGEVLRGMVADPAVRERLVGNLGKLGEARGAEAMAAAVLAAAAS